MTNVLDSLKVTTPYKAVIVVSGAAFLIVLLAHRDALMIVFGGIFLIGLGEWRNHPRQEVDFRPSPAGVIKVTDVPLNPNWSGNLLQVFGVACVVFGLYWAFRFGIG
jgi:hypothetical protein